MNAWQQVSKRIRPFSILTAMLCMLILCTWAQTAGAETGDTYTFTDRQGTTVTVPVSSFASFVVSFKHGTPWTSLSTNNDPKIAVGLPDADDSNSSTGDLCLGKGGVLVLGFNSYISDGEGDDIYVFEVGADVEATKVEVSSDLKTWYTIGRVEGRTAGLDIRGKVPANGQFRYVRLTDTGDNDYDSSWPGSDIDTVCGLHSVQMDVSSYNKVFSNFNAYSVTSSSANNTSCTFRVPEGKTLSLKAISLYHYNGGSGSTPGTITLSKGSQTIGSWKANGRYSNSYWDVFPDLVLKEGNYTVTCSNSSTWSYNSGSNYAGFTELYGTVSDAASNKPPATAIKSLKAGKKCFTVKWKKQTKAGGYQIQYAKNKKFTSGKKTVTVKSNKTISKKIKKLKAKTGYYVRVRTYRTVSGKKYYSSWSKAKKVVTK